MRPHASSASKKPFFPALGSGKAADVVGEEPEGLRVMLGSEREVVGSVEPTAALLQDRALFDERRPAGLVGGPEQPDDRRSIRGEAGAPQDGDVRGHERMGRVDGRTSACEHQAGGGAAGVEVQTAGRRVVEIIDPEAGMVAPHAGGAEILAMDVGADSHVPLAQGRILGPGVEPSRDPVGREQGEGPAEEVERVSGHQRNLPPQQVGIAVPEPSIVPEELLHRVAHHGKVYIPDRPIHDAAVCRVNATNDNPLWCRRLRWSTRGFRFYRLQLQSPLPVLQWPQRQELDLQKQAPLGAATFSAWVGSAFCGGGVQPIAITTAASTIRSFVTVAS
jgi:hypothetical protein